ncbi:hypothetical protein [Halobacteriovorax sp. HLS]|uniref:hypothetical protein n=1 Tax=Halobacteriovorax sp. HLS TaxID=2234000 RepID=UPI000FD97755|nr:hypothetical protein [Halobacteriovorax sp. HLS]
MKNNFKVTIPLAIVITLIAVIYQRATGPTYPKKIDIGFDRESQIRVKLPRSQGGDIGAPIEIPKMEGLKSVKLTYKRYPTNDEWTEVYLEEKSNRFYTELPNQPPAGKLTYFLELDFNGKIQQFNSKEDPIYIRYKGEVPTYILAPHVFCMFLSMLLSALALFECLFKTESFVKIGRVTLACLMFGGMFLGPIVQKFAFGVYWAGFPYDWDLTDNKLLVGVLVWVFAVAMTFKKKLRWPVMLASIVLFCVYSIPHSMQGSEFNYEKGVVETDID